MGYGAPPASAVTFDNTNMFTGNMPTAYTDLDLSSVTGAEVTLVLLLVKRTAPNASQVAFRTNGDTGLYLPNGRTSDAGGCSAAAMEGLSGANTPNSAFIWVTTDSSGIVEWIGSAAEAVTVDMVCYIQ